MAFYQRQSKGEQINELMFSEHNIIKLKLIVNK